jgi:hypothetical protein
MTIAQCIGILVNVEGTAAVAYEALYRNVIRTARRNNTLFLLVESEFVFMFFQLFAIGVLYAPYILCGYLACDMLSM